ncbi:hypothetical protein VUR80DRAFT_5732 [Thermomyces stellatus]
MARPTLVIIPGSSSLPEFYTPIVDAIRAHGYEVKALKLPSVVDDAPTGPLPTMYDDAAHIQAHVAPLVDAGKDVILVTHSYGGTPGTQSIQGLSKTEREAQGLRGGVVGIAYITSLIPEPGKPISSVLEALPAGNKLPIVLDENGWIYYTDIPALAALSFSDMPKEEGGRWARKLVKHSSASFEGPLTYAGFKDVTVSFLLCQHDKLIVPKIQRAEIDMIERETGRKNASIKAMEIYFRRQCLHQSLFEKHQGVAVRKYTVGFGL